MKYIAIGFLVFVLNGLAGITQELVLKSGDLVVNNDTIYLTGTKSTELLEVRLSVTNNTESAVSLKLKKTEIFVIEGAETSFCWGECYTPAVFISPMIITIQPRGSDLNSFSGDYRPFGMEGTSMVRYTFLILQIQLFSKVLRCFTRLVARERIQQVFPDRWSVFIRTRLIS